MNTVAHVMIGAALLARKKEPVRNLAVIAGAIAPDFSIYVFFAWSRIQGWSFEETWDVRYWTEPWQSMGAISNAFILAGLILAFAYWRKWPILVAASCAALLHLALDFPLHSHDAHIHFWPITDWRFHSPVSYWDVRDLGLIGAGVETICVFAAAFMLWNRFNRWGWRIPLGIACVLQILMYCVLVYASLQGVEPEPERQAQATHTQTYSAATDISAALRAV